MHYTPIMLKKCTGGKKMHLSSLSVSKVIHDLREKDCYLSAL